MRTCPQCGRRFARNDVLIKHLRSFHGDQVHCARVSRKSCSRCVLKKTRCDRGRPCQHCVKAEVDCLYHPVPEMDMSISKDHVREPVRLISSPAERPEDQQQQQQQQQKTSADNGTELDMLHDLSTSSSYAIDCRLGEPFTATPPQHDTVTIVATTSPSFSTAELATEPALTNPSRSDGPFLSPNATLGFGFCDLDWLDVDFSQFDLHGWQAGNDSGASATVGTASPLPSVVGTQAGETSVAHVTPGLPGAVDLVMAETEREGGEGERCPPRQRAPVHHWPFDDDCQNPTLPHLRSLASRGALSNSASDQSVHAATAPHRKVLDAYFNHFHEILPIMHVPSFNPSECPAILVAALSTVGAMFVHEDSTCKESWPYSAAYLHLLSSWVCLFTFSLIH